MSYHRIFTEPNHPSYLRQLSAGADALADNLRILAPVKRNADVDAVLAHAVTLGQTVRVTVLLLHVTTSSPSRPSAGGQRVGDTGAEAVLTYGAQRCRALGIAHACHIREGELVFTILDAAEMLASDVIVMHRARKSRLRQLFSSDTVRRLSSELRYVPLVAVQEDGAPLEPGGAFALARPSLTR